MLETLTRTNSVSTATALTGNLHKICPNLVSTATASFADKKGDGAGQAPINDLIVQGGDGAGQAPINDLIAQGWDGAGQAPINDLLAQEEDGAGQAPINDQRFITHI